MPATGSTRRKKKQTPKKVNPDVKKARKKRTNNCFGSFIHRVLKQVHADICISKKAMSIMDSFVKDIFERIAVEAGHLTSYNKKKTLTSWEIASAVRLLLRGELAKYAHSEATKAMSRYVAS